MELELRGAAAATGHTVVTGHWAAVAAATGPCNPQLLKEQHMAATRVKGVAVFALGCVAAEARRKCRHRRRGAGRVARGEATLECPAELSAPKTFYELLGVPQSADNGAIKHAYHSKMKACHPDVSGEQGVEMALLLNEAYALLRQPEMRRSYDNTLPRPGEDHSQVEEEDDGYDLRPVWKYKPASKEECGVEKPVWRNRPRSRSNYDRVPEEDRGEKWEAQQFLYVNTFNCIACRNCLDVAPKTFTWDNFTGRAKVFQQWGDSEEYIDYSLMSCPVDCIHWVGREELQAIEHVTATAVYDCGGQLPCAMGLRNGIVAGDFVDPFSMAMDFRQKLKRDRKEATDKIRRQTGMNIQKVKLRIQEAFNRLPSAVRQLAWPRWAALLNS
jgi:curved DNA-binding protein CbpA